MVYKINHGEFNVYLSDNMAQCNVLSIKASKAATYQFKTKKKFLIEFDKIEQSGTKNHIFYHDDVIELFNIVKSQFQLIEAAGGLVVNELGEILFIYRNSKWDLPKGKAEPGELIEKTAVREVEEETGIKVDHLEGHLMGTFHTYLQNGKKMLKHNHWFVMNSKKTDRLIPQLAEGIEDVEWISPHHIEKVYDNCYRSIKDIIHHYLQSHTEH
jgi:8-oxo-dGTP pyrophosphatase MutT (NUDIX family)